MSSKSLLSSPVGLWMIHGNLQTPTVWQPLHAQLTQAVSSNLTIFLENLWASPGKSFQEWATLFCQRVETHTIQSRFLLGYSLGGRLAFHALLHQPDLWQGAIVISADPGLSSERDRKTCLTRDKAWSNRFLHNNWEDLLKEWNRLPVFCGRDPAYAVLEKEFSRPQIAEAFQKFSKGHQANLLPQLQKLNLPILYIAGEEDFKYCQIGQILADHCPTLTYQTIPDAGHRVPWENPAAVLLNICQFLEQHQQ